MIYKFSEASKNALESAEKIAIELGHNYIGTEHILYGLIKDYNYNNNYLEVEGISNTESVSVGDYVYTSGLGNIVEGIYVGSVSKVDNDSLGLVLDINLIDNSNLNYVGVIK